MKLSDAMLQCGTPPRELEELMLWAKAARNILSSDDIESEVRYKRHINIMVHSWRYPEFEYVDFPKWAAKETWEGSLEWLQENGL